MLSMLPMQERAAGCRYRAKAENLVGNCRTACRRFSYRMSVAEPVMQNIADQVGIGVQSHLLENSRAIGADSLHAERELAGDLRQRHAGCDQQKNLMLPNREHFMRQA